ncbi:multidrug effflux MFS transporter [Rhizobacter sp. J219]|jgi:DHA1 family bicyclomycin/chloramphenicol resistance-like MFS transporter|uniref:multidrug effflux MFS transporter n=1 Tax=Rhizobacter sp. J219 TaxID=2898430 RepID=UPI002151C2CB|nr:multidrug effflux MFS transporter [Rhizobacter sp. J219]MCR5882852.1 multidrug effflux MFS transporter [Rhizobacter sp. J219]
MTPTPAAPAAHRVAMSPATVVLLLTLLMGIQPVTTDLYLPALPALTRDLGANIASAQLTLSALIICFGFGQLVCGPLADRFGRQPVLRVGLSLYTIASVLSAAAPAIEWLVLWRALQGAAMAAAVTCGRSIIRDLYAPHEGARVMSRALTGLGTIAMASPVLGGVLVEYFNWHAALTVLAVFGAVALGLVLWRFEETVPARNPSATRIVPMLRNWRSVATHPTFLAWATLSALTYGGLFVTLAGSSFVVIEVLGISRAGYGLFLLSSSIAYTAGTFLCRRLLLSRGLRGAVAVGGALSLAGGVSMAALSLFGVHNVWAIAVPQWLYALGHGIHQPCGQAGAVGPFPEKAGTAASLSGFGMSVSAFLVSTWLGKHLDGTVYPLTLGVGVFGVGIALVAWTLVQRHGEPQRATAVPST